MILVLVIFLCGIACSLGIAFLVTGILLKKSNLYGSTMETLPSMKKFRCVDDIPHTK